MNRSNLLVTFPVDLGNRTLESNLKEIFSQDMDHFRFAENHAQKGNAGKTTLSQSIMYRLSSARKLRGIVSKSTKSGNNILFHGISPALFSFGAWQTSNTSIIVDWTRTLYPSVLGESLRKNVLFNIHRNVLLHCNRILCLTDAVMENLIEVYKIPKSSLYRVPMPFQVELLDIPPRQTSSLPKVLFVGGDLRRKGGDIVLNAWQKELSGKCQLTMMTNDTSANIGGVNFISGVEYGSDRHKAIFKENDILILPTRIDGYPQVVGEAAAAGLAVITTKYALGSKEVIVNGKSGYIADSPEECIPYLTDLLSDGSRIDEFKKIGYQLMHRKFSKAAIRTSYLEIINSKV